MAELYPFHPRFRKEFKTTLAGMFGNILEWYDFALYGFMAIVIANLFFAQGDPIASLLATYGIFAAGFFMRPIGAAFFGYIGDRFGRRPALILSVVLMGVATFLLGCLPTYATAGVWASILLVILRLAQGLSVGGEFSTSVTYMVEHAPHGLRGFAGSFANIGSTTGMLMGVGAAALVTSMFPHAILVAWAWRLPFLFGGVLGMIGLLLTRHLPTRVMHKEEKRHYADTPFHEAFFRNRREMIEALTFSLGYAVLFYLGLVYLPTYANEFFHLPLDTALQINTAAIALTLLFIPLFGYLSDKIYRRRTGLMIAFALAALAAIPLFLYMNVDGLVRFGIVQFLFAIVLAVPLGTAPALYVELFPKDDRLTAYSISFNFSLGVFGGTTPLVVTWLIHATGNTMVPAYYLIATLVIALIGLAFIHDRSREALLR